MINIKIAEIAKRNGLNNAYALQRALNCSPTMASRLWKGEFKQIGIETVDSLCELFACFPSDLIVFTSKSVKTKLTTEKTIKKPVTAKQTIYDGNETLLSTAEVAEKLGIGDRTVRDYYKGKSGGKLASLKIGTKSFVKESDFIAFRDNRGR
jgi:DNA-binding Xre family transcriptional regulator